MKSSFKVSVIIPVYNSEEHLIVAVESALALHEVGEVLLIDDGSTDHSLALCRKLERLNKSIKTLQHADLKNHGPAATRNLGIAHASCDYISFLDADDLYSPNRFANENLIFGYPNDVDGVYGCSHTIFISEEGKKKYYNYEKSHIYTLTENIPPQKLFNALLFYWCGRMHTSAITVRKDAFKKTGGFNEKLKWAEDTDMWLRLALKTNLVAGNIKTPISFRRIHNTNIVHQSDKAAFYKNKMYHELFNWALRQKSSFEILNNIHNAHRLYTDNVQLAVSNFFWKRLTQDPRIVFTSFFWKKLRLLYF